MRKLALLALIVTAACSSESGPPLVISDLEITRPMPGASMSAGYFLLENRSAEAITITRVDSPQFGRVEVHETILENDVSKMRRLDALTIPANGSVRLERGGKHLMLMRPADDVSSVELGFFTSEGLVLSTSTRVAER
ncbi:MAG: copper chaperone PCu(A)C [Woeseiaceae bacterium]|nr:copper chaperone PCu(A)C [Woeseiaceae bacterium]